ncbi:hypothetical protein [Nonomuraea sp. WAC 01424]|uniref:hypothetical protein n=1 Tax=Nonomuraea sp. WAC 01424 TaxID=2203200 RepID=UPI000F775A61|nr:hypothetical protein [Nonomuraea sp. WAC 01424]
MRLWTVQHRAVLVSLETDDELAGDWARLSIPSYRPAYEEMVAEMARRGLDCRGRPPVWAWPGPDTRDNTVAVTAEALLCPQSDEEFARYVVLDLDVPDDLVMFSSYGRWNDFMEVVLLGGGPAIMDWTIGQEEIAGVQACLPCLPVKYVLGARPLEPFDWAKEEAENS